MGRPDHGTRWQDAHASRAAAQKRPGQWSSQSKLSPERFPLGCAFGKRLGQNHFWVHSFCFGVSVALPEDFTLQITLANRSSTTVDIEVPSEGVTAKWEVIVQDFGVGMKATLYPDDGSTAMEVIPSMKIKAEGGLKEGLVLLPKRGKLQVTFDNTYSIFRSKTFDYRLSGANTSLRIFPVCFRPPHAAGVPHFSSKEMPACEVCV